MNLHSMMFSGERRKIKIMKVKNLKHNTNAYYVLNYNIEKKLFLLMSVFS